MRWILLTLMIGLFSILFNLAFVFANYYRLRRLGVDDAKVYKELKGVTRVSIVFPLLFTIVVVVPLSYFTLPTLTFLAIISSGMLLTILTGAIIGLLDPSSVGIFFLPKEVYTSEGFVTKGRKPIFAMFILFILTFSILVISPWVFSPAGATLAGEVFSPIKEVSLNQSNLTYGDIAFTIVPYKTAQRRMGSAISRYGILYRVSDADYQYINGTIYWVGSVSYGDFWKWLKNKDSGIDFVVILKATKNDEAKVVKLKEPMHYTLYNYFGNDVKRLLWKHYPEYKITTPVLQLHDGKAYYVAMLMKPVASTLWSQFKPYKLAVVDASTGKITLYDTDKAPKWVTFVHQEDEVEYYLYKYFVYRNGFINRFFGQKGVLFPTGELTFKLEHHTVYMDGTDVWMVFIKGKPYWYSALRPPSSDNAMVSLALVDANTGQLTIIDTPGYYNDKASAQNIFQSPEIAKTNTLKPTAPIPIIIDSHFGWLSTIVSTNNELQFFAIADASNGKVFTAPTVKGVIKKWLMNVENNANNVEVTPVSGGYKVIITYQNGTTKEFVIPVNTTVIVMNDKNQTVLTYKVGG